ncbi:hypothetical protein BKA64DRAFT_272574 [Cadophora sp. MPI-SDFR-AT-0126]|nr:hypothetical protein BKA64DRAFT_272574 [Leotiomycetes sp. MPI-SDFR-AT-0126]
MGHEILQITAPDSRYGIVHARGSYADNPDAILARAQRFTGGKSTFGLKWLGGSPHTYRKGRIEYHGLLNFRWPYKRHDLLCPGTSIGTVASLSFVKDEMVYQVLRFEPGKPRPPPPPPVVQGSERLASRAPPPPPPPFLPKPWPPTISGLPPNSWDYNVEIKIGGMVRLDPDPYSDDSNHAVEYKGKVMSYIQDKIQVYQVPHEVLRLNFELFINGQKEELSLKSLPPRSDSGEIDMVVDKAFRLEPGKPTVIVGRIALGSALHSSFNTPLPTNDELAEFLGATATSENATDRVWGSRIDLNADIDDDDFCTSAACLEQIMGVTSVPMRRYWKFSPQRPSSADSSHTSVGHEAEITQKDDKVDRPSSGEKIAETRLENIKMRDEDTEAQPSGDLDLKKPFKAPNCTISDSQNLSASGEATTETSEARLITEAESDIAGSKGLILPHQSSPLDNIPVVDQRRVDEAQSPRLDADLTSLNNVSSRALSERETGHGIVSLDLSTSPHPSQALAMDDPNMGIALVSGILCNQWVDVQGSFWQIRYLVKAHNFLVRRESHSESSLETKRSISTLEESTSFEKVRTSYLNRIKFHIHHSLVWIARARLPSGYRVKPSVVPYSENVMTLDTEAGDDDRALYPPIVIWYVIKNCPDALPPVFITTLADCIQQLVSQEYGDVDITSNDHEPNSAILLWYRYYCLAQISQHLRNLAATREASSETLLDSNPKLPSAAEITGYTSKAHAWQRKAEKAMASSRRAALDSYSNQDESADRLSFLGIELGLANEQESKRSSSCLAQARRRILDRKPTLSLNPGAPLFGQDGSVRVSTSAPWELTCVNHHIRLQLWSDPDLEDGLYTARKNSLRYLSTNFLFIGSWDTSKSSVAASFWDLDASCMICATFLDMRIREESLHILLDPAAPESPSTNQPHTSRRRPSIALATEVPNEELAADPGKLNVELHGKRDFWDESVVELLRKQLEKQDALIQALAKQSDNAFAFDWTRCEPPVPFHPATWLQSLDDTPELFRSTETRRVHLRSELERYLNVPRGIELNQRRGSIVEPAPDWTAGNISDKFEGDELMYISIYDIGLKDGAYRKHQVIGRLEPLRNILIDGRTNFDFEFAHFFAIGQLETRLGMWASYLDNHLGGAPEFRSLPDSIQRKYNELAPWIKALVETEESRQATKAQLRKKLLARLSDSLVDCDTHNRIFAVRLLS